MKIPKSIYIGLVVIVFFTYCTKEEDHITPRRDLLTLKSTKVDFNKSAKANFNIYPSGDASGVTDFQNISEALQAAGPGDVVELEEGLFYLHKSIVTWDFSGTLRGVGMGKTTIQTAPGVVFDVSEDLPIEMAYNWTSEGHSMLNFPEHYNTEERTVVISDLTFVGNEPTTPWIRNVNGAYGQPPSTHNNLSPVTVYYIGLDNDLDNPVNLNVYFENIIVLGQEDPKYHSEFGTHFSIAGIGALGASDGVFVANIINVTNAAVGIVVHMFVGEGSTVSISNVNVENAYNGISTQICHSWIISDSELRNCSNIGIYLDTYGGLASSPYESTLITDNKFIVAGGPGIVGIGANNVQVQDNIFNGSGFTGIYARIGNNWNIADNNLCDLSVFNAESATIILRNQIINSKVEENANQVVGGLSANDPSNFIGETTLCN